MQINANDFLKHIKIITDDYKARMIKDHDDTYNDFLDNCKDIDLRKLSDVDCKACNGAGLFNDYEGDYEYGLNKITVICPCIEANEDNVVKYWNNKKESNNE